MDGLERYQIKSKISAGGMATVFLARDTVLGRDVAVKMMHSHLLDKPESVKRFATEATAIAALSHENIIKIYDYGRSHDRHYLVMEYVEGHTVLELIYTAT